MSPALPASDRFPTIGNVSELRAGRRSLEDVFLDLTGRELR